MKRFSSLGLIVVAGLMAAWCLPAWAGPAAGGKQQPGVRVLFDFTTGNAGSFSGGKIADLPPDAAGGAKSALVVGKEVVVTRQPQDWSGYDQLKIDVFNASDDPQPFSVEIHDAQTQDYWTRVNYMTMVPPGRSTVTMPASLYVGEKSRPGRLLITSQVTVFCMSAGQAPLMIESIRLQKIDTASVRFDGLHAFSFIDAKAPVMAGYRGVTKDDAYNKQAGYGWIGKMDTLRCSQARQPDTLYQTFVIAAGGTFQVDLPNGKYHALMNIDSPGGFWGEGQTYTSRQVRVNGQVVVDEKMTLDQAIKKHFQNARREDLPGINTFQDYVQKMFNIKEFDFDVADGNAEFAFAGDGQWPITLSALVIYPESKSAEGLLFWGWTMALRQEEFNNYFKQIIPKPSGEKAPAQGFRLFTRYFMTPPNAYDGPLPNENIPAEGLSLSVAQGEEGTLTFSVQPGSDLGAIDLAISQMKYSGPSQQAVEPLKTGIIQPGWVDFRLTRITMDGTAYKVAPRYWHPTPSPSAPGVTRTFWLRIKPPVGTAAGTYQGQITVQPAHGAAQNVPLKITILPFALDPITDVAVGPYGCSIGFPWHEYGPEVKAWHEQMLDKCLTAIHDIGCTTLTGFPSIGMKAADGKVTLDFTAADEQMKLLRAHGFDQAIDSYGVQLGYRMYGTADGPNEAFAKKAGFADMHSFLKALWGPIEEHAKANNWLPVIWNLCDEPSGKAIAAAARNAEAHQAVSKELGLTLNVFSGVSSMYGDDPKSEHYDLVRAFDVASLNGHDEGSIKVIHDAGHKFSFYNGGNRWTFGRYMKALVVHDGLMYRPNWHFNAAGDDPYYALDSREDDYCWYNTDENQTMVPALYLLMQIQPGLNDYRYLSTLERLLKEKANSPAATAARKVYDQQLQLVAGKDRTAPTDPTAFESDRKAVVQAILSLLGQ